MSIDEFKGNTWGETYQCILADPVNRVVLDILPKRYSYYLTDYFKDFPVTNRKQVAYFVSDMWRPYAQTADVWFASATQVVDKYHWIRQAIWAFERVRKDGQKKLGVSLRRYFKRSKSLLIKRFDKLTKQQKTEVNIMLYNSVNISRAYYYKETFLKILDYEDLTAQKAAMKEWIASAERCGIAPFEKCAKTMQSWHSGIIHSLESSVTNGFTEGCNNKIKALKETPTATRTLKEAEAGHLSYGLS